MASRFAAVCSRDSLGGEIHSRPFSSHDDVRDLRAILGGEQGWQDDVPVQRSALAGFEIVHRQVEGFGVYARIGDEDASTALGGLEAVDTLDDSLRLALRLGQVVEKQIACAVVANAVAAKKQVLVLRSKSIADVDAGMDLDRLF